MPKVTQLISGITKIPFSPVSSSGILKVWLCLLKKGYYIVTVSADQL